jgi:hypothetical protein
MPEPYAHIELNIVERPVESTKMTEFTIPAEIKAQLIAERLQALNLEGYQHELNKKAAEAVGNLEAVAQADEAITIIKNAITVHEAELA